MTNLDNILKSRDITWPTKDHLVKAMILPVVMYGCESSTINKTERRSIDAFELWCWRRLLRLPWTARRSNQSTLKEISPEYSLEELMLKLNTSATWWEEMNHWKRTWRWERFRVGGEGDDRCWDGWMASPTWWTWVSVNSRWQWRTGKPGMLPSMGSQRVGHNWVTELNWISTWLPFPHPTPTLALLGILSLWQLFTPTVCAPQLATSCLQGLPLPHGSIFSSIPLTSTQFPFPLYTIL